MNIFSPFVLSQFVAVPGQPAFAAGGARRSRLRRLRPGHLDLHDKLDLVVGVRGDREHKDARPQTLLHAGVRCRRRRSTRRRDFSDVSPQFAVAYRVAPTTTVYGTVARGFKAGGFNAGVAGGRRSLRPGAQLELRGRREDVARSATGCRPASPRSSHRLARSAGQRAEPVRAGSVLHRQCRRRRRTPGSNSKLHARPPSRASTSSAASGSPTRASRTAARRTASTSSGNKLANAPSYTADFGVQYSRPVRSGLALTARAEAICYGDYQYDDANTAGQDAYSLTQLARRRARLSASSASLVRNAFDTRYIPVAFPYPGWRRPGSSARTARRAPSGFASGLMFLKCDSHEDDDQRGTRGTRKVDSG